MSKTKSLDDYDLGTKSNEGVEIELLHPTTGEGLGMFIKIVGRYSEKYQAAVRKVANDSIKKAAKGAKSDPVDDNAARGIALLAACTVGWRTDSVNTLSFHGKDNVFSEDAAVELYGSKSLPWVQGQIDKAMHTDANFMKP